MPHVRRAGLARAGCHIRRPRTTQRRCRREGGKRDVDPSAVLPLTSGGGVRPAPSLGRRRLTRSGGRAMTAGPGEPGWGTGRAGRRSGYRTRSYYLPDDLHFRLRNAWWHTQNRGDHDSLSALVASALRPVVEELESRHNSGHPFPELPPGGRLATGPRPRRARPDGASLSTSSPGSRSPGQGEHMHTASGRPSQIPPEPGVEGRGRREDGVADLVIELPGVHGDAAPPELEHGRGVPEEVARPRGRPGCTEVGAEDCEDVGRDDRHEEHGPRATGSRSRGRQADHGQPGQYLRRAGSARQPTLEHPVEVARGPGEKP